MLKKTFILAPGKWEETCFRNRQFTYRGGLSGTSGGLSGIGGLYIVDSATGDTSQFDTTGHSSQNSEIEIM
jgi:hypothetical protein